MALAELEHWLAEAERLQPLHEQVAAAKRHVLTLEADMKGQEAAVALSDEVRAGKNEDGRKALISKAIFEDKIIRSLQGELDLGYRRLAEADGALEAQRTRLALVKAWWTRSPDH